MSHGFHGLRLGLGCLFAPFARYSVYHSTCPIPEFKKTAGAHHPPPRPHSCYHVPYALLLSLEEEDGGKERKYNIQHDLPPSRIDGRTTPCLRQRTGIILGKIDADYHSLSLGTAEQAIFCFSFFPSYRRGELW